MELLYSLTPPEKNQPYSCFVSSDGRFVDLAAGDMLHVFDCTAPEASTTCRFRLPAGARPDMLAVHPSGEAMSAAVHGTVWGISRGATGPNFAASVASDWGQPRSMSFDPPGKMVWLSFESRTRNQICALDWELGTLGLIAVAECPGPATSCHRIHLHPDQEVVALSTSDEQKGSRVTYLQLKNGSLQLLGEGIELPGSMYSFAGFSKGGERFVGVTDDRIQLWSWPDCMPVSAVELDGHSFLRLGSYVGGRFVAPVKRKRNDSIHLAVFDHDLKLQTDFAWQKGDQSRLLDVIGLIRNRFLVLGDSRAGVFRLGLTAQAE